MMNKGVQTTLFTHNIPVHLRSNAPKECDIFPNITKVLHYKYESVTLQIAIILFVKEKRYLAGHVKHSEVDIVLLQLFNLETHCWGHFEGRRLAHNTTQHAAHDMLFQQHIITNNIQLTNISPSINK